MADEETTTTTEETGAGATTEETTQSTTETTTEETGQAPAGETPEAKTARLLRETDRHFKKYPHLKPTATTETAPATTEDTSKKSSDFDYGQKAYLKASGIQTSEEMELVKTIMSETGKDLDGTLESNYFQAELKSFRENKATRNATPGSTKRASINDTTSVEYWQAKGELPPNTPENQKLRQDIVNARLKSETTGNNFTANPVVK